MTEPRSAEASLMLATLEELPMGVWVARVPDGEEVYSNRMFSEIMGTPARGDVRAGEYSARYQIQDQEGRPFPEEKLPFVQALNRRHTVVVDDIVIQRGDGSRVNVRAWGKPLLDATGTITHVMVTFTDITAQVAADAASVAVQAKLQTALHHAPIVLFASDAQGTVTVSEGAALRAMGYASGELLGKNVFELYRDNPSVIENNHRALAGESFTTVNDLGAVVLETWMGPLRDASGAVSGVIGVSTDVTERLRMQRQVTQADRLTVLGRLAASVAHEINNPLTYTVEALRLAIETLGGMEAGPGAGTTGAAPVTRLKQLLADANEGADRVRLITRDLKAFSRADDDARRPLDLNQAISSAIKLVAKRVETRANIAVNLGPPASVHANDNRLVQIFVNLILNAVDAMPAQGASRNQLRMSTWRQGDSVIIEVADNGPGVPASQREQIFEPFFTTKAAGEGTGLGLFVTRNLVEALGGTIVAGAAPEGGALFSVRLPVVAAAEAPAVAAPPARPRTGEGRRRILIVDDERQLTLIFRLSLLDEYDVHVLNSGRAALAHLLEDAPYDLVLCDLMMADFSGMNLYQELQRRAPGREKALVFMTGGVFDPEVGDFLASIPNECVDKPFDVRAEVRRRLG